MQNKPNFLRGQINATLFAAKDYENKWQRRVRKNKPKTNPIQTQTNPISEKPKMSLNFYSTKDYDNKPRFPAPAKQTQFKPNQTQFHTLSNAEGPPPKVPIPPNYPLPATRNTQYDIRDTTYEIRNTRYEIRDTKYKPNPPAPQSRRVPLQSRSCDVFSHIQPGNQLGPNRR